MEISKKFLKTNTPYFKIGKMTEIAEKMIQIKN